MDEIGIKFKEIVETSESDILYSSGTKKKSDLAVFEAKRVANEVRQEFDRNIREVQEVASKIFTEARGQLYERFEKIERETCQFMWDILGEPFQSTKSKPALKTESSANTSKTTFKTKGSNTFGKPRQIVEIAKKKLRAKVSKDTKASKTLARIDKIVDRVKRLKKQVEINKEVIDQSLNKIEKRLVQAWSEIKTKPHTDSIERLLQTTETEIIKDIGNVIETNTTKKISSGRLNKSRQKPGLIVKKSLLQKPGRKLETSEEPSNNSPNIEGSFQELKRHTARFAEITDADLQRAIETIKAITQRPKQPLIQLSETSKKRILEGEAKSTIGKILGNNKASKVRKGPALPIKPVIERNKTYKSGGDPKKPPLAIEDKKLE